ncbi:hypothetical protein QVD17_06696 [Tagetes erecta]|uniref:Uncharacterized protein n=1 Tax=Tagetes erecta TaxID=13708 RepID=A0AAD8LEP5_TARER|nr:hypothetical protein QVD17_06696 [Tagetes erecta]
MCFGCDMPKIIGYSVMQKLLLNCKTSLCDVALHCRWMEAYNQELLLELVVVALHPQSLLLSRRKRRKLKRKMSLMI